MREWNQGALGSPRRSRGGEQKRLDPDEVAAPLSVDNLGRISMRLGDELKVNAVSGQLQPFVAPVAKIEFEDDLDLGASAFGASNNWTESASHRLTPTNAKQNSNTEYISASTASHVITLSPAWWLIQFRATLSNDTGNVPTARAAITDDLESSDQSKFAISSSLILDASSTGSQYGTLEIATVRAFTSNQRIVFRAAEDTTDNGATLLVPFALITWLGPV